jgi:hypothetical protein
MKKSTKILGIITCWIVLTIAAINVSIIEAENAIYQTSLKDVEAHADISEWWNSKTHSCEEDTCSVTYVFWTYYGKYEKCKSGNNVAHCWNCASCDA